MGLGPEPGPRSRAPCAPQAQSRPNEGANLSSLPYTPAVHITVQMKVQTLQWGRATGRDVISLLTCKSYRSVIFQLEESTYSAFDTVHDDLSIAKHVLSWFVTFRTAIDHCRLVTKLGCRKHFVRQNSFTIWISYHK